MTRGAWIAPLLFATVLAAGAASAHPDEVIVRAAATAECDAAGDRVAAARKAVKRAKRALKRAETRKAKARARKKLKRAKKRLTNALARRKRACAPESEVPGGTPQPTGTPPPAPQLGGTEPSSPSNSNTPHVRGTAASGSTVKVFATGDCGGAPLASGSAAQFASGGLPVSVPDNSTTAFRATATNANGTSPCSPSSISYVEDSQPPPPPTLNGTNPPSPAETLAPQVIGTAEPGSTVKLYTDPACATPPVATGDAGTFGAGGLTVNVPANATTGLRGTATDQAGNTSGCSAPLDYTQQPPNQPPSFGPQTVQTTFQNTYTIVFGQVKLSAQTRQITISPGATDPDGDPLTYTWEASTGTITGDGLSATWIRVVENYQVVPGTATVTASDGHGGTAQFTFG